MLHIDLLHCSKLFICWISTTVFCHFIRMLLSSPPFSSVVCSTVKAPPTGLGDVLQRIQSDRLGLCRRKFLFTLLRVDAIKKRIGSKNESGFRQSRLRVNVALVLIFWLQTDRRSYCCLMRGVLS